MGFTIGSFREIRDRTPRARRRIRASVPATIAEYTGVHGWAVAPGARTARGGPCDCGTSGCRTTGAHPLRRAGEIPAGATAPEVAAAWARTPGAPVLLPVGRAFDVLDVAEEAGCRAWCGWSGWACGSARCSPTPAGRALFLVAPGAADELPRPAVPDGLGRRGARPALPGPRRLRHRAVRPRRPPARCAGCARRPPTRPPPEARLLLGTLAYVCHRHATRCGRS